ncbi:type VI secretion system tube protein Hcp (plasmid) [Paracoccus methylovorus]|uniref:Type VI secretion system tube protein Hcp n=1 Tax=Paracoccus methylovorus TaxID=2812658 RepID=A0ABX7JJM1_9RHOB|nr:MULTISPECIES: type VI secretion system tube protein Hcp [Paracoccus]QRZ14440.1 type VI secretion system tube protein Hcp [Paracoccus methylovorus]
MAFTGYLKIDGIDGESRRAEHEGEIDIWGADLKAEQKSSAATGSGRVRGRATVSDLTLYKWYDAASPYLALACMQGKAFPEIVFVARKDSGDAHLDYLTITMTNCLISSYSMTQNTPAPETDTIGEQVGISFEKIAIKYVVQADDHSKGDEHEVEYDLMAAK